MDSSVSRRLAVSVLVMLSGHIADQASAGRIRLADFAHDVTSQCGENGILAKLFETIGAVNRVCVEVGAHHLTHLSNVAPLWMEQGWKACLIEGRPAFASRMAADYQIHRHAHPEVGDVLVLEKWVAASGPNALDAILPTCGIPIDLDFMSIDVDGIDFHIWAGLEKFQPRVVAIEYNNTIPPELDLVGQESGNFVGASARALLRLGQEKGYALVACTKSNLVFTLDTFADRFDSANDLDNLFERSGLCYVMRTYEGGVFLSRKPTHGFNPFSCEPERSLPDAAPVFFPDKSFRHLLELWEREMRVRARAKPFRRALYVSLRATLVTLHWLFGRLFRDPDIR